jgi:glycosyltransferase involved in cell wall biosynthesis
MSSLIIVTASYPFGVGEPFFAIELEALAKTFDMVAILPATARSNIVRTVPENVKIMEPLLSSRRHDLLNILSAPVEATKCAIELLPSRVGVWDILNAMRLRAALSNRLSELRKEEFDLVYVYWGFPFSAMVPMFISLARCVLRFHGSDLWGNSGGRALRAGVTAHLAGVENIFFVSEMGKSVMRRALTSDLDHRLHVRYLGSSDLGVVSRTPYSVGLSIMTCAFLKVDKRLDRVAKVVNELSRSVPVTWTHVGGGDDALSANLLKLAGHRARTEFLGNVPHEEISELFHKCRPNLLMSMSNSEGLAINVLEAMSANVPIVSTDVGGMKEAVSDRVGILVEKGHFDDTDALAKRILSEILPGGLLAEASPRSAWEGKFDARANAKLFAEELKAISDAKNSNQ